VSKARLVITAVVVEGRSQHEVARVRNRAQPHGRSSPPQSTQLTSPALRRASTEAGSASTICIAVFLTVRRAASSPGKRESEGANSPTGRAHPATSPRSNTACYNPALAVRDQRGWRKVPAKRSKPMAAHTRSPSATGAASSTSASDEPTPEPPSSCSSTTSTSESSTQPQVSSSAPSPSTPPGHISPPAGHLDHHPATPARIEGSR
jgi:hypothetical protein